MKNEIINAIFAEWTNHDFNKVSRETIDTVIQLLTDQLHLAAVNDITEMLINMSMENQRFPLSELKMPEIKVTGGGNIYNTNNAPMINVEVQGDLTKSTLPDLQTILKKANTYTQNEIRKNMKRFG